MEPITTTKKLEVLYQCQNLVSAEQIIQWLGSKNIPSMDYFKANIEKYDHIFMCEMIQYTLDRNPQHFFQAN